MDKIIKRDDVLQQLRDLFAGRDEVVSAIVFGSTAREGVSYHDVDVAVRLAGGEKRLLTLGGLVHEVSKTLGVSEERVDVVDVDQAPIPVLWRILRDGVVVKGGGEALEQLGERVRDYPDLVLEAGKWVNLDPEPKVDKAVLETRISEVRRNTGFLRNEILNRRPEELSYGDVLALERAVHRIAEAMLDVCRHLVAIYSLGVAESYGEYPEKLASAGKMPRSLAGELSKVAGLRNIIVHRYVEVKPELLYEASRDTAEEVAKRFIEWARGIDP